MQWRFIISGDNPEKSTSILFSTNEALKGWKLFSVRWDSKTRFVKLDIDAGRVFEDKRAIDAGCWPQCKPNNQFQLGGWNNTWLGGLSLLEFYNFRIFDIRIFRDDLRRIYAEESELIRKV